MDAAPVDLILSAALAKGERPSLEKLGPQLDAKQLAFVRGRAFTLARAAAAHAKPGGPDVLGWLERVCEQLAAAPGAAARPVVASAHFSPGPNARERIVGLLRGVARTLEIAVFTISDDRVAQAIEDAHNRGVAVRIVTDNDKANDLGSDVHTLASRGVPVAVDRSPFHMHHKFAIFDRKTLLTGSYNWTRGAAEQNVENIVVVDEAGLVASFLAEFERLWRDFAKV